jgi:hypothetical protein
VVLIPIRAKRYLARLSTRRYTVTKGNTIENIYVPAKLRCTVTEHKNRDANDDTAEHHIIMYTTPDAEPTPLELIDEDNGSIY